MQIYLIYRMIARMLSVGRRNIHSTVSVFCRVNSEYSNVDTEKILRVVNNSSSIENLTNRYAISAARAKKLHSSRQRSGKNILTIEEIQHIGGFDVKVLNKFCRSILDEEASDLSTNDIIKKARRQSYTFPPMPLDLINHINSFTSIHCGMTGLSWTTFERTPREKTKITNWVWRPFPESNLKLYHLAAFMSNTLKDMPKSDFYVFENPNALIGSASKFNLNNQITQVIGMASVIAAQNNTLPILPKKEGEAETMNFVYLRQFLFARLFKIYIGKERISTIQCVEDIFRMTTVSQIMDDSVQTMVDVDRTFKAMYSKVENNEKESLGCSFLLGLAFLRLILLKCPISISLLESRQSLK